MTTVNIKLTMKELELLIGLASDQLFRREFIDPRMPGYKAVPGDLSLAKELIQRLRLSTERTKGTPPPPRKHEAVV